MDALVEMPRAKIRQEDFFYQVPTNEFRLSVLWYFYFFRNPFLDNHGKKIFIFKSHIINNQNLVSSRGFPSSLFLGRRRR
jgi:hypothetical protein